MDAGREWIKRLEGFRVESMKEGWEYIRLGLAVKRLFKRFGKETVIKFIADKYIFNK